MHKCPPHQNAIRNRYKIIVRNDYIRCLFADIGAVAHRKTNIGGTQRRRIDCAITTHTDAAPKFARQFNHAQFCVWGRTRNDTDIW